MQKPFDASLTRKSCHAFGCIDVHRLERVSAARYVQADGVYHGECTIDGHDDLVDIAMDGPQLRAGIRERHDGSVGVPRAMRTAKLASCRWRTMRRPRNPVPPNTVTNCAGIARPYPSL